MKTPSREQQMLSRSYDPHRGYIGEKSVRVSNYLFALQGKTPSAYPHTRTLAQKFLEIPAETHYRRSRQLTQFIRRRGLTFAKKLKNGGYKQFAVPVTTTPVLLPKSMYNQIEVAAQVLLISLRHVLQSIYGARSVRDSEFVQSLPESIRQIFVETIEASPTYLRALHHPNMKTYPFFDVVGLDLVMTEDLTASHPNGQLPFKILEINAGSPSGASNNTHVLQGLMNVFPEFQDCIDRVMPNDHFETLARAYRSLGESWTGRADGISVILPPGGQNGAAPEIHQLAAISGLVYCDSTQLYRAEDGTIRLRTLSGQDPVVTSIYSRVNSDSALFDLERGIAMRDAETGETIYLEDTLLEKRKDGKYPPLLDSMGKPIPAMSMYTVPNAVEAIHQRQIYIGGLNRVLDNKILLPILSEYAPKFYRRELEAKGLTPELNRLRPPTTLLPGEASVAEVLKDPENWVIKAPDLSGGSGVHILRCMTASERAEVMEDVHARPDYYTYQRLVNIGRIPVATKHSENSSQSRSARFANLAADVRMWVFFGDGPSFDRPRLTHNGLVRVAPEERGPNSSIVNTSKGGGYSSLLIVDDVSDTSSVPLKGLDFSRSAVPLAIDVPIFVGAQLIQIRRILEQTEKTLNAPDHDQLATLIHLALSLKTQTSEVLSFLHPQNMEPVTRMNDALERIFKEMRGSKEKESDPNLLAAELAELVSRHRELVPSSVLDALTPKEMRKAVDAALRASPTDRKRTLALRQIHRVLIDLEAKSARRKPLSKADRLVLQSEILAYRSLYRERLSKNASPLWIDLLETPIKREFQRFDAVFPNTHVPQSLSKVPSASQLEYLTGTRLVDTDLVPERLREARLHWLKLIHEVRQIRFPELRARALEEARTKQRQKYPELERYQSLALSHRALTISELVELLDILPYAKYNLLKFCKSKGITLEQALSRQLEPGRISLLTQEERKKLGVYSPATAGECFARRNSPNSLFGESDILLWVAAELPPIALLYTIGHELGHYHQIQEVIDLEKRARAESPVTFAQFLNFFGNFLGTATLTVDPNQHQSKVARQPLFGLADMIYLRKKSSLVRDLVSALRKDEAQFQQVIRAHGGILGLMMPVANSTLVKAIREAIPALENGRNLAFAHELGIETGFDEVAAMMPAASAADRLRYGDRMKRLIASPRLGDRDLRVLINHQLHGVRMPEEQVRLEPHYSAIFMGMSYNAVQQQQ